MCIANCVPEKTTWEQERVGDNHTKKLKMRRWYFRAGRYITEHDLPRERTAGGYFAFGISRMCSRGREFPYENPRLVMMSSTWKTALTATALFLPLSCTHILGNTK